MFFFPLFSVNYNGFNRKLCWRSSAKCFHNILFTWDEFGVWVGKVQTSYLSVILFLAALSMKSKFHSCAAGWALAWLSNGRSVIQAPDSVTQPDSGVKGRAQRLSAQVNRRWILDCAHNSHSGLFIPLNVCSQQHRPPFVWHPCLTPHLTPARGFHTGRANKQQMNWAFVVVQAQHKPQGQTGTSVGEKSWAISK